MTQIGIETTDNPMVPNLKFNDVFASSIVKGFEIVKNIRVMADQEYGWLVDAEANVQKELMSWKGK